MMIRYIHLNPSGDFPNVKGLQPFRAIVVAEDAVKPKWQSLASKWLVNSGCLYMLAWGVNASSWDDSIDLANLEAFNYAEIPDDSFVITTWHDDEPLQEVFWFAKMNAIHPTIDIENTLILHISEKEREKELLDEFAHA